MMAKATNGEIRGGTKYLGKIVEYTKTVGKKTYNYMDVRIENREELQERFRAGDYVKVSLESLDLK